MGTNQGTQAFRVIEVTPGSPAQETGLAQYLDFIVMANGVTLQSQDQLARIVQKNIGCRVLLQVYNELTQTTRDAVVVPGPQGLGCSVRWDEIAPCGLRVIDIQSNSIAECAGLRPAVDFVLGTRDEPLNDLDRLPALALKQKKLELFVFSTETQTVRKVLVSNPLNSSLGITLGAGVLNELPRHLPAPPEEVVVTQLRPAPPPKPTQEPPPPPPVDNEPRLQKRVVQVLPPPSIFQLNSQRSSLATKLLNSKYVA